MITDVVGLAAGVWLLWGTATARAAGWRRDLLVLVGIGVVFGTGSGVIVGGATRNVFAVIRIWTHLLIFVLAPLCVARGIHHAVVRNGRRPLAFAALLVLTGLSMGGTYAWARYVEPFRLQTRHYTFATAHLEAGGRLRIVVLADLQTDRIREFEERVFREIEALAPDLLLVPGDLLQSAADYEQERRRLIELFRGLTPPQLGIHLVDGDVDRPGIGLEEAGVRLLQDEVVALPGTSLQIYGLSTVASRWPLRLEDVPAVADFAGLTIVMGHSPDFAAPLLDGGSDADLLCVAGHTHGGQVVIPGLGPPITLSSLPRRYAAGGFFEFGRAALCISRGVGVERGYAPPIRLFCPPELVVIDLRSR